MQGSDKKSEHYSAGSKFYNLYSIFIAILVYVPLSMFLASSAYILFTGSADLFGTRSQQESILALKEFDKELINYRNICLKELQGDETKKECIENYLSNTLFSKVSILEGGYSDVSNSFNTIAIMTGFFGVLMTVLIIYFSLTGRESRVRLRVVI